MMRDLRHLSRRDRLAAGCAILLGVSIGAAITLWLLLRVTM
jgi:hypothetical protein